MGAPQRLLRRNAIARASLPLLALLACEAPNPAYDERPVRTPDLSGDGGAADRASGGRGVQLQPSNGGQAGTVAVSNGGQTGTVVAGNGGQAGTVGAGNGGQAGTVGAGNGGGVGTAVNTLAVGLVGYWSFDEGGGAVAVDRSGNGNDGALTAALDPATSWVTGRRGKALAFPNADHAGVEVPPSASLDRIRTAYTLGAWVRRAPNAQTYNTVISRGVDQTYFEHYSLSIWERRPSLHASHAGKDDVHVAAAVTVTDGAWQYVAATFDGEVIRVYLDAKLGHEQAYPGPVTFDGAPLLIGNNRNHWTNDFGQSGIANEFMVGALDEVVIYDRALSVAEIAALASGSGPL